MAADESVSNWLTRLQAGDDEAVQQLWDRYFPPLVRLARARLAGTPRRATDEEDVALSGFASFCRGAEAGRFPQLADRTDLWKLLVVITARKAADVAAKQKALRYGGGKVVLGQAELQAGAGGRPGQGLDEAVGREPAPDFAAQVADEYERRLAALADTTLRSIAGWKLEGYTNAEIADKLGCAEATVERKLQIIRRTWESAPADEGPRG